VDPIPTTQDRTHEQAAAPRLASLIGALLLSGAVYAFLALGGQLVAFLVITDFGPVVLVGLSVALAIEVERAVIYLVTKWRPPRLRLALTGVIAALPVLVADTQVGPKTVPVMIMLALVLRAAMLAYLSSAPGPTAD
jgi:hypothetical protein